MAMGTVVEVGVEEGVEVTADGPCGPGAPCGARLKAMEEAHRRSLRELQERHTFKITSVKTYHTFQESDLDFLWM